MHHLSVAHGSLGEVETQVWIAARLNYLDDAQADSLLTMTGEVGRLINGLANSLANTSNPNS